MLSLFINAKGCHWTVLLNLSDEVFGAGMAYVAWSRVRSLSGLYLSAFSPKSLSVSATCLKEVNRLRQTFRQDLPLYDIPYRESKHKLTGTTQRRLEPIT